MLREIERKKEREIVSERKRKKSLERKGIFRDKMNGNRKRKRDRRNVCV